jgi:hypothetical protein
MATEHIIDGPLRLDGAVGITLGSDGEFDLWYRNNALSTGVMTRLAAPSGIDGDYLLQCSRSGATNVAPVWTQNPIFNNRAVSLTNPGFSLATATSLVVGFTGSASWTAAASPFFDNSGSSFVFPVGATGGLYTIAAGYDGQYEVAATATWDNTVNRGSRTLNVLVNGTVVPSTASVIEAPGDSTIDPVQTIVTMVNLVEADTISIEVAQGSDSSVTVLSTNLAIRHI